MALVPIGGGSDKALGFDNPYGDGSDGSLTWGSNSTKGGIFQTTDLTITSGTTITISSSNTVLVVMAQNSITVEANVTINGSGAGGAGGSGGNGDSNRDYRMGNPGEDGMITGPGAAGGGAYDTASGGLSVPSSLKAPTIYGTAMEIATQSSLDVSAGGTGGSGSYYYANGGNGGSGGGGLILIAPDISVDSSMSIDLSGTDGQKGDNGSDYDGDNGAGGGGGGAGGVFLALGQNVNADLSNVDISGGAGGAGGTGGGYNSPGDPGEDGVNGIKAVRSLN